jgi:hypothetical protein
MSMYRSCTKVWKCNEHNKSFSFGSVKVIFPLQVTSKSGNLVSMNKSSSFGSVKDHAGALAAAGGSGTWGHRDVPTLSRAEAMASTAVRAADKVQAKLVRVFSKPVKTYIFLC